MIRSVVAAVIGSLAVLAAALPLRHLFEDTTFLRPAVLAVATVVLVGVLVRAATRSVTAVFATQCVALVEVLATIFARDTLWYALPTPATLERFADLLLQSRETILEHAAPAPVNPGVDFSLAAIIALIALTTDLAAATAESPTLAGLPVVALYGISAANAPRGLPWLDFLLPAALWLLLLALQTRDQQRRWVNHVVGGDGEDVEESARRDFVRQGVGLAAAGLALAIVVPTFTPHLPPTVVATGLRPDTDGEGDGGRGRVAISSEIDLRRSMEDQDPSPVLRYRTDDPSPPPLRVGVAREFVNGRARIESTDRLVALGDLTDLALPVAQEPARTTVVEESRIRAPQLPTPFAVESVDGLGEWFVDDEGVVQVGDAPSEYSVTYRPPLSETDAVTEQAASGGDDLLLNRDDYLGVDEEVRGELEAIVDDITGPDATPLETAQAIQSYLRGADFTYDLELAPRGAGEHPVSHFLRTRQGYCQQFAATMVHLARVRGIPARFVVGFLPGTAQGTGEEAERVVRAADAHAWPELYLDGVGWLRFEPTPGARAAAVPGYSIEQQETTETTTTSSTTSSTTAPTDETTQDDPTASTAMTTDWLRPLLWLLAVAALLAVLPLTALVLRERSRRTRGTPSEQVEADWCRLLTDLQDLGIEAPSGATPRATGQHLARRTGARGQDQLRRVVGTLERARYAPPEAGPDPAEAAQVRADVDDLLASVHRSRAGGQRVRTALLPGSAVRWWAGLPGRLIGSVRSLLRR